ncbi:circadian clock protein KaiC [Paraburkholderia fungorum]|uniref:non-specific serine/threonine protein kinase n=1 Tax=Paraburkholderia fungorum TaxID=134537 RepID=A0A1H1JPC8_9BURK|nr:ATPase domain-containing protein [Paraburkholderia fungorum]SDR51525.1 circadian clock protein KaiC [Paraburkholderia fungorum]
MNTKSLSETFDENDATPVPSGVPGLDDVLSGGFPANRIHLLEGAPGSGKTTLALQFLLEGIKRGESVLYITLAETKREVFAVGKSHGWVLDELNILAFTPPELSHDSSQHQSVINIAELEQGETLQAILAELDRIKPVRVVLDSLSEIRLLTQGALRYRRQLVALKRGFLEHNSTALLLDDLNYEVNGLSVHSMAHGVVSLQQMTKEFGPERRRLRVSKMRGVKFKGGYHDFAIEQGGLLVYPRLVAADHPHIFAESELIGSGIDGLDTMMGGGIDRGTNLLLLGPSGAGKSTLSARIALTALQRGERVTFFNFDEAERVLLKRCAGLGMDLAPYLETGRLMMKQVDPAELSPGELAGMIRDAVEENDTKMVVLDSLGGYLHAMPEERFMLLQMHELLLYLNQHGIATVLVLAQHGLIGETNAPVDMTYLADAILLLRFFEADGRLRRAISMIKKRTGAHEMTIREFMIDKGVRIGQPLERFRGLLQGSPVYSGEGSALFESPTGGRL